MAQRVVEGTDADAKLKQALLDKEAELRRSLDDADRCSTLQHSCTSALATCTAALATCTAALATSTAALEHAPQLQRASCRPCTVGAHDIQPARHATCAHVAYDRQRHRPAWLSQPLWCMVQGRSHLHRDWARPSHICTGTGLTPPTSAPGLGSPFPHPPKGGAHPSHICTGAGTGAAPCLVLLGVGPPRLNCPELRVGSAAVTACDRPLSPRVTGVQPWTRKRRRWMRHGITTALRFSGWSAPAPSPTRRRSRFRR